MESTGMNSFTHVDPFEDTESASTWTSRRLRSSPVSPTSIRSRILKGRCCWRSDACRSVSPTSIRSRILKDPHGGWKRIPHPRVSPTSIRSRILKGINFDALGHVMVVSPTSIRSRILKVDSSYGGAGLANIGFTHVDPFEDTESAYTGGTPVHKFSFTHVDPFEDTESR